MTTDADIRAGFGFNTPFAEQLDFFRGKLNLPTERWDDIMHAAHDRAFIVAGASKADLLHDLRQSVDNAIAKGSGLDAFRREFNDTVTRHGWTGWTGQGSKAGEAWRTKVIYQTNMSTSYAAGRYRQLTSPAALEAMPFWKYIHNDSVLHPRPQHLAWNGLTLKHDDPFWTTHFPPNGWGCHCRVRGVRRPAPDAPVQPPEGWDAVDPATESPDGIDRGFSYQPGASAAAPLQGLIDQKLIKLDAPIGAAMWDALKPALLKERTEEFGRWVSSVLIDKRPRGASRVIGAIPPDIIRGMAQHGVQPRTAEMVVRDEDVLHTFRDAKKIQLPEEWYRALPQHVDAAQSVALDTTMQGSPALLYVFDLPGQTAKLVLGLDYSVSRRNAEGKKERIPVNVFRTGRLVDRLDLVQPGYVWLAGKP